MLILATKHGITYAIPANLPNDAASDIFQLSSPPTQTPHPPQNLTIPSLPDLHIQYHERRNLKLHHVEMYCNSIFAIIFLSKLGWDTPVLFRQFQMTTPFYRSELIAREEDDAPPGLLKNKHMIMVIYGLGLSFAARSHFNYHSAVGSIGGRAVVRVTLQLKGTPLVGAALLNNDTTTTTRATIPIQKDLNETTLTDAPGKFIDPDDPDFVIHYTRKPVGTEHIYVDSLFTTFTEALVNLAPHRGEELGASVNTVGYERSTRLVVLDAGTAERPLLSYGRCTQALGQIWRGIIELQEGLRTMRFDIEYKGVRLGSGFMKGVVPQAGVAVV
ncbi:MAG: hypothetical protein Q9169_002754 [Polycauliona sp. 2 TL-2023]